MLFQNDINVFNEIKNLESAKIFENNIHLMTEDNKFNQDKKICNWAEENKYQFEYTTDGFYKDSHLDVKGNQMVAKKIVEVLNER